MRSPSAPTTIIVLAVFFLTTPVFAQMPAIQIKTICVDGAPVIGATCSLTIGQHQGSLITPGTTTVKVCADAPADEVLTQPLAVVPRGQIFCGRK